MANAKTHRAILMVQKKNFFFFHFIAILGMNPEPHACQESTPQERYTLGPILKHRFPHRKLQEQNKSQCVTVGKCDHCRGNPSVLRDFLYFMKRSARQKSAQKPRQNTRWAPRLFLTETSQSNVGRVSEQEFQKRCVRVKALTKQAWRPEFDPESHVKNHGRRKLALQSCSLTSTVHSGTCA